MHWWARDQFSHERAAAIDNMSVASSSGSTQIRFVTVGRRCGGQLCEGSGRNLWNDGNI